MTLKKSSDSSPSVRVHGGHGFVVASREFVQHEEISFEAVGLMLYILSKPENWKTRMNDLRRRSKRSKGYLQRIFKELAAFHYAKLEYIVDENGMFQGREWVLYWDPNENPDKKKEFLEQAQTKLDFDNPLPAATPAQAQPPELPQPLPEITLKELYKLWDEPRPRQPVEIQFCKLTTQDREEINQVAQTYVEYNPDPRYRMKLENYINATRKNWQQPLIDRRNEKRDKPTNGKSHIATVKDPSKFHI